MLTFTYVVAVVGEHVRKGYSIEFVIKSMDNLDEARRRIKDMYGVEFEDKSARFHDGYWVFANITDDRDINLAVERIDCIE